MGLTTRLIESIMSNDEKVLERNQSTQHTKLKKAVELKQAASLRATFQSVLFTDNKWICVLLLLNYLFEQFCLSRGIPN